MLTKTWMNAENSDLRPGFEREVVRRWQWGPRRLVEDCREGLSWGLRLRFRGEGRVLAGVRDEMPGAVIGVVGSVIETEGPSCQAGELYSDVSPGQPDDLLFLPAAKTT